MVTTTANALEELILRSIAAQEAALTELTQRFDHQDQRFDHQDQRFAHQDQRFDHQEQRFDRQEQRFDHLTETVLQIKENIQSNHKETLVHFEAIHGALSTALPGSTEQDQIEMLTECVNVAGTEAQMEHLQVVHLVEDGKTKGIKLQNNPRYTNIAKELYKWDKTKTTRGQNSAIGRELRRFMFNTFGIEPLSSHYHVSLASVIQNWIYNFKVNDRSRDDQSRLNPRYIPNQT